MAAVIISNEADASVLTIAKWLADNASAKAKMDFLAAVADKIKALATMPQLGRKSAEMPGLRGIIVGQHYELRTSAKAAYLPAPAGRHIGSRE